MKLIVYEEFPFGTDHGTPRTAQRKRQRGTVLRAQSQRHRNMAALTGIGNLCAMVCQLLLFSYPFQKPTRSNTQLALVLCLIAN